MISFDSEKDMEDAMFENIQEMECIPWVAYPMEFCHAERQVRLGAYGIADIVVKSKHPHTGKIFIDVIELKNTKLKLEHVAQVARYKSFFSEANNVAVNFHLVGLKTLPSDGNECFIFQEIEWLSVYEISFDFNSGADYNQISGWKPTTKAESCGEFLSRFGVDPDDHDAHDEPTAEVTEKPFPF
jgi:hypothetical protein